MGIIVVRYEKKLKKELYDETKLAGLQVPAPEEPGGHPMPYANRLTTFVTYMEAKTGLRTRVSKPNSAEGHGSSDVAHKEADDSRAVETSLKDNVWE